jgi:hypothetical protein
MATETRVFACGVCGGAVEAAMSAECNWCDQRFHLNQRNDVEGRDCGRVWIDEQYLALQFACNGCLSSVEGTTAAPVRRLPKQRPRRYKRRV